MLGSLLLLLLKCRHHGCRFRKRAELNSAAAAAVSGGLESLSVGFVGFLSANLAGSLFSSLAGFSEPAAAASPPSRNLVKNLVEFCDFG